MIISIFAVIISDTNRFKVENYSFTDKKISKKTRLVFLTDLHNKVYGKGNNRLIDCISNLKPDIIVLGGDIINAKPGKNTDTAQLLIKRLNNIAPVIYGMGNHEFRAKAFPNIYGDMFSIYQKSLCDINLHILENESLEINNIKFTGVSLDYHFYKRFKCPAMDDNYLNGLIGAKTEKFTVLLAHNPDYFENYVKYGADIVLSGHIHGGMIRLPLIGGLLSPKISFFPRYSFGAYSKHHTTMIVSRGLGVHTVPIRFLNPGEVTCIDLIPNVTN